MNEGIRLVSLGIAMIPVIWIGLLPRVFFRPGRRSLQWWLNALPFWVAGTTICAALLGVLPPVGPGGHRLAEAATGTPVPAVVAILVSVGALLLLHATVAVHRRPLALWHQTDDRPEHLVTDGPYGWVRHPFYSSFVLALAGCLLAAPHAATLVAFVWAVTRLRSTAIREEARFLTSELAEEYRTYMGRTGRLVPRRLRPRKDLHVGEASREVP